MQIISVRWLKTNSQHTPQQQFTKINPIQKGFCVQIKKEKEKLHG